MRISGAGCLVVDYIYHDIDFSLPEVSQYLSKDGINGVLWAKVPCLPSWRSIFKNPRK